MLVHRQSSTFQQLSAISPHSRHAILCSSPYKQSFDFPPGPARPGIHRCLTPRSSPAPRYVAAAIFAAWNICPAAGHFNSEPASQFQDHANCLRRDNRRELAGGQGRRREKRSYAERIPLCRLRCCLRLCVGFVLRWQLSWCGDGADSILAAIRRPVPDGASR